MCLTHAHTRPCKEITLEVKRKGVCVRKNKIEVDGCTMVLCNFKAPKILKPPKNHSDSHPHREPTGGAAADKVASRTGPYMRRTRCQRA